MKFNDLRVGLTYRSKKEISTDDVIKFAKISGDENPIHLNHEYAKQSIFKDRIVHGMLIGSYFSKAIASDLPGPGSIYLNQTMQFVAPIYHNSVVEIIIEVIEIRLKKQIAILSTKAMVNGNVVILGEAIVKCLDN